MPPRSQTEVRQGLLALFPPGDSDLYAFDDRESFVARHLEAVATAARRKGTDAVDELRREQRPQNAVAKLPDWERVFGVTKSRAALYGSNEERQGQVVARWREHGAATVSNIRAALAAVCGYEPAILEHSRAGLTTTNYYPIAGGFIPALSTFTSTVDAADNAPASQAGVRLIIAIEHPAPTNLAVTLTPPDGGPALTIDPGQFTTAAPRWVYWKSYAGRPITGRWTLTIGNGDPANLGELKPGASLLVEGIGRDEVTGAEGKAAPIFYWTALVNQFDPQFNPSTFDRALAAQIVRRWNPAHCRGWLAMYNSAGGQYMRCGDPMTPADGGICA